VAESGITSMSLALMGCQPPMLDAVEAEAVSELPSSAGRWARECCSQSGEIHERNPTSVAPFFLGKANNSLGSLQFSLGD